MADLFPPAGRGRGRLIAAVVGLLALATPLTVPPGPAAAQGGGSSRVEVDSVRTERLVGTLPVVGRVFARDSVIAAEVEGVVARIHKDIGDAVQRGEPILELDTTRLRAEVALNEADQERTVASVAATEADLALAQQDLNRIRGLRNSAAFSQQRLEDAQQEVRRREELLTVARAQRRRAEVALELAKVDLQDATIVAPFSGVVTRRDADVGEYVTVGAPTVTLLNDHNLEVEAAVPTDRVAGLEPGREVTLRLDDETVHTAIVRAVLPVEDGRSRTRVVRFMPNFGETQKAIAGNQSLTLEIPATDPRDAPTVHKDAVLNGPRGAYVFVARDGAAVPQPVRIGAAMGNRFEVVSGLQPGDLVVVRGNERLRPGAPIAFDPPPETSTGSATEGPAARGPDAEGPAAAAAAPATAGG